LAPKVEDPELWALNPQLWVPKVGNWNFSYFILQLSTPKLRNLELGALGPQLLVLEVETQELSIIHLLLEKKILS